MHKSTYEFVNDNKQWDLKSIVALRFFSWPETGSLRLGTADVIDWCHHVGTAPVPIKGYKIKMKGAYIRFEVPSEYLDLATYLDEFGITPWLIYRCPDRHLLANFVDIVNLNRTTKVRRATLTENMVLLDYTGLTLRTK